MPNTPVHPSHRHAESTAIVGSTGRTVPAMLMRRGASSGARPLVVFGDVSMTGSDVVDAVGRWAGSLSELGAARGDRVVIMSKNRPELLLLILACGWIGAIAVPVNTEAKAPQLGYYIANAGARIVILEAPFSAVIDAVDAKIQSGLCIRYLDDVASADTIRPTPRPLAAAAVGPGDPFVILYTSGTTGPSKGVVCPHAQLYWWGVNSSSLLDIEATDTLVTTLPMFHTNALNAFFQALLTGATICIEPRFSTSRFWDRMIATGATVVYLLGAMVPMVLSREAGDHERSHRIRTGLAPGVPAHLMDAFEARTGVALLDGYGATESNFVIGQTPKTRIPGSIGRVMPGFQARVVDDLDEVVPDGQPGELILRADEPFAFASGYFGMPEKTVETWRNMWLHTGDRVVRHADGTFTFVDRLKDVIRRRGENISSYEVEQALLSHPDVTLAAAYPVASDLAEDEVMAAIVLRAGVASDPAAIIAFCMERLPRYAVPRYIAFDTELPATENGKVQKFKLRERGIVAGTYDREASTTCAGDRS